MHTDEVFTDAGLAARLVARQFPQWSHLPVVPVESSGTDNALFRLGDELVVRLPRIGWAVGQAEKEIRWLPRLAGRLPLAIPVPLVLGEPDEGYPWSWSVYRWLKGRDATEDRLETSLQAARDLAGFLLALQAIVPEEEFPWDENSRALPLATRDQKTRAAIAALGADIDTFAALAIWDEALVAPGWNRPPVLVHGDLLPGNLVVSEGRLSAVIDFNNLAVGDPACDLMVAWAGFTGVARQAFRDALEVDDATWKRGRGHSLSQAVIFLPYYRDTNPVGVANARRTLERILA